MNWNTKLNKSFWILIVATVIVLILIWGKDPILSFFGAR